MLALLGPGDAVASPEREAVLAALNGVLGDHLEVSANPLAISMHLRHEGRPLAIDAASLSRSLPQAKRRMLLLVHGLCMNPLQWRRNDHDYGATLAKEGGFTPLHVHYNTGLHVSSNGRMLADRLQALQGAWPVPLEEIVIVGHSMGGLIARSSFAQASARGDAWPGRLTRIAFLG